MFTRALPLSLVALGCLLGGCAAAPPTAGSSTRTPTHDAVVTGSRIPRAVDQAGQPVAGDPSLRSYDDQAIQQTGRVDVGQALSTLDPAVTSTPAH